LDVAGLAAAIGGVGESGLVTASTVLRN
jgi:hypothetical protein